MRTFISVALTALCMTAIGSDQDQNAEAQPGSAFALRVENLLAATKQTSYQHTTKIDEKSGSVHCDCSGLIGYVLRHEVPEAYVSLHGEQAPWRKRPLAVTYYETFVAAGKSESPLQWTQVRRLMDVVPGDVVAWRKPTLSQGSTTGHVLMIASLPEVVGSGLVRVRIIDSTRNSSRQGFGEGFKTFAINEAGEPIGYLVGKKHREAIIAIGRLHPPKEAVTRLLDSVYIGKGIDAATKLAKKKQFKVRIIRKDGEPQTVPWKIDPKRLNFVVQDGKVTGVLRG